MEAFGQKKYTCVVYPGVVKDEERMITTLGGLENISMVFSKPNRRLELRFRPDDVYCHSACADRHKTLSLLVKVKVKKKKVLEPKNEMNTDSRIVSYKSEIMGRVETTFNFKSLCDFQYLPVQNSENGVENIYPKLVPKDFPGLNWFYESAPPFLAPAAFSRMDSVQMYLYRKESNESKSDSTPANIIGRTRCRRSAHAVFVTFDVPAAPSKPRVSALKYLELKFLAGEPYKKLLELFEKRPVWSKTALAFETKYKRDQLKYLLPAVAYYFVTGPFRVMWVRMGYDPRKDPSSKIYQTLDYRIPNRGGLCRLVKAKRRTDSILPFKSVNSAQSKTVTILQDSEETNKESNNDSSPAQDEVHYIFQRGVKLPARQIFYQYCDIKVPEVEEMFARLPKPSPDFECHRQRGWLPPGFAERVREIITSIIFEEVEKEKRGIQKEGQSGTSSEKFEDYDEDEEDDVDDDIDEDDDEDEDLGEDSLSVDNNSDDGSDDGYNELKLKLENFFDT